MFGKVTHHLRGGLLVSAMAALACFGCDDDGGDGDSGGAGGAGAAMAGGAGGAAGGGAGGGAGGAGAGGGEINQLTFDIDSIQIEEPSAVRNILGTLLNRSFGDDSVIILVQLNDWATGDITVNGGAGQYTAGGDTEPVVDNIFTWLTEGECINLDGEANPCNVDVGSLMASRSGDMFTSTSKGDLNIYSEDLKLIIPLKSVEISGTVTPGLEDTEGPDSLALMDASLSGFITVADASETLFELVPGNADTQRILSELFDELNVERVMTTLTDGGEPVEAYPLSATITGIQAGFVAQ
ncbi:MAG: hypothetical protein ACE366_27480 [Bradymonadia bacterium]